MAGLSLDDKHSWLVLPRETPLSPLLTSCLVGRMRALAKDRVRSRARRDDLSQLS